MLKWIAQWLVGATTVLAVGIAAVAWSRMTPAGRDAFTGGVGRTALWIAAVAVLPWATWFVTAAAAARRESNAAGAALVVGYTAADVGLLALLPGLPAGGWALAAAVFGLLAAAAYNLLACDWLAERGN